LVNQLGIEEFRRLVETEWAALEGGDLTLPQAEIDRITAFFAPPSHEATGSDQADGVEAEGGPDFALWARTNLAPHKMPGHAIVNISLKATGEVPGDASAEQMEAVADLADRYSLGEIRVTHEQNLVLPSVKEKDLPALWRALQEHGLATANIGLISDIIACPGLDYCNLANARAIPVAQKLSERFADLQRQHDIGDLKIKISGCINACGHHHVGSIGILGVDKRGEEFYQITLGGSADENTAVGKIIGPAFSYDEVVDAIDRIVEIYLELRETGESFNACLARLGLAPFKEKLYGSH
jgi:sulfite reductase (NADPH) hemoprotein beta-component